MPLIKLIVLWLFRSDSTANILNHFFILLLPSEVSYTFSGSCHCLILFILSAKQESIFVSLQISDVPQRYSYGFPVRVLDNCGRGL